MQTVQVDGICREVIAPAPGLDPEAAAAAQALALRIASSLDVTGLLAVELFETAAGGLLVNELAMRPHNSGHWTIDGARTSQFEQHLRAVPPAARFLRPVRSVHRDGEPAPRTHPDIYDRYIHVMAADPAVKVHFYGKEVRPGRKIGHVTITLRLRRRPRRGAGQGPPRGQLPALGHRRRRLAPRRPRP